jgi:hypothetical protein
MHIKALINWNPINAIIGEKCLWVQISCQDFEEEDKIRNRALET